MLPSVGGGGLNCDITDADSELRLFPLSYLVDEEGTIEVLEGRKSLGKQKRGIERVITVRRLEVE